MTIAACEYGEARPVAAAVVLQILRLLGRTRGPLPACVIAASANRSVRQTRRALIQLVRGGQVRRGNRAGEGRRGAVYEIARPSSFANTADFANGLTAASPGASP